MNLLRIAARVAAPTENLPPIEVKDDFGDVQSTYDGWKESQAGEAAFEEARQEFPNFNDSKDGTSGAVEWVMSAFEEVLQSMEIDPEALDEADTNYIYEDIHASFT